MFHPWDATTCSPDPCAKLRRLATNPARGGRGPSSPNWSAQLDIGTLPGHASHARRCRCDRHCPEL
eukprot:13800230-Alexandrium_andersonii.AAC.1